MSGEHTTVTKCPACGRVTVGMPEVCPGCSHLFTLPDANLPAVREQTTEFQTRSLRDREPTTQHRNMPRHVVVPLIAGLLVAIVVVVVVRLNGPEKRQAGAATGRLKGPADSAASVETLPVGGSTADAGPRRTGGVPSLGPGARKVAPAAIVPLEGDGTETGPREAVLLDGDQDTCYFTSQDQTEQRLAVRFGNARRFSHVLFHVSCLRTTAKGLRGKLTLRTDDGMSRSVSVPGVAGPTWVDLAGAWTGQIEISLDGASFEEIGLGELEFFAFDD